MTTEIDGQLEFNQDEKKQEKDKIKSIIESIIFASNDSVNIKILYNILKNDFEISKKEIEILIEELRKEYNDSNRGFELIFVADGYQLKTKREYAKWVGQIFKKKSYEKLSKSALETLSILAYKQPITRAEIEEIRGVNVDGVMRVLLDKGLVFASGKKEVPGKPSLYSTTKLFLTTFGLKNLQELPPLGELNLN